MDETINDRIKFLIDEHYSGNVSAFAREIGVKQPTLNTIVGERKSKPSYDVINAIALNSDVDISWLITGEGEALISGDIIKEMRLVQAHYADNIKEEEAKELALASVTFVPLLPVSAQGGTLNDFIVSVHGYECEKVVSPVKGADFAITVSGDSMAPEYTSGSQVLIKKINENAFIDWGKTYVLDTCNGIVIKNILPGSDKSCVKCESVNTKYPPFEVRFEDIYGIYRVLMCMSMK